MIYLFLSNQRGIHNIIQHRFLQPMTGSASKWLWVLYLWLFISKEWSGTELPVGMWTQFWMVVALTMLDPAHHLPFKITWLLFQSQGWPLAHGAPALARHWMSHRRRTISWPERGRRRRRPGHHRFLFVTSQVLQMDSCDTKLWLVGHSISHISEA